jgi:hypothetical protein
MRIVGDRREPCAAVEASSILLYETLYFTIEDASKCGEAGSVEFDRHASELF